MGHLTLFLFTISPFPLFVFLLFPFAHVLSPFPLVSLLLSIPLFLHSSFTFISLYPFCVAHFFIQFHYVRCTFHLHMHLRLHLGNHHHKSNTVCTQYIWGPLPFLLNFVFLQVVHYVVSFISNICQIHKSTELIKLLANIIQEGLEHTLKIIYSFFLFV